MLILFANYQEYKRCILLTVVRCSSIKFDFDAPLLHVIKYKRKSTKLKMACHQNKIDLIEIILKKSKFSEQSS